MKRIIGTRELPALRDRIRSGVRILFVGINPGVRSALTGHHFAGFSNRFWKLLYDARLVPEPITFIDDDRLPDWGFGITNIVPRATPGIDTLQRHEYVAGRKRLLAKIQRFHPNVVALVGVTVFRALFPEHRGAVSLGPQHQTLGTSAVFVLPNTSGRNANFSYAEMLQSFRSLKKVCGTRGHRAAAVEVSEPAAPRIAGRRAAAAAGGRRLRSRGR
jgi:TDG/mug DNA glycosylase family protein